MAKFITIATTVVGAQPNLFNTDTVQAVSWLTATTFAIYAGPKTYTFTTSAGGATSTVAAVHKAIFALNGPLVAAVDIPVGVTISALPAIT